MKKFMIYATLTVLLSVPLMSSAEIVTTTGADGFGTSSFNSPGVWSNGQAPANGNDYFIDDVSDRLRTPPDGGDYTFAGDSLTVQSVGAGADLYLMGLTYKGAGDTGTITIGNLILDGGTINHLNGTGDIFKLAGSLNVLSDSIIIALQGPIEIYSDISGSGQLIIPPSNNDSCVLTFYSAANTFSGDIINLGRFVLADDANLSFEIGANGINNSFSSTNQQSAVFSGDFSFDLSAASTVIGDSWAVVDTTPASSFTTNFTVSGFLDNGDGSWFLNNGSAKYKFYENSGILEVVSDNIIPVKTQDLTPADQSTLYDETQPEISITLIDGTVDLVLPGTVTMTVGGDSVTPSVTTPEAGTTFVSYTPASPLAAGPVNVQVTYEDSNVNSYTNSWSFNVHPTTTDKLWNINIAGNAGGTPRPVADGVIALAPSAGANQWNNFSGNNGAFNSFLATDVNGGNDIGFETDGSHNWGEQLVGNFPPTVDMFMGWTGANAPMNMTAALTGLNPANAYDIYIYSTWAWTQNPVNYEIVEGFAEVTSGTINEIAGNVQGAASDDYSGCVYGENYIVFSNVTPNASGRIAFTGVSTDGVLSGLQVLEIPGGGALPELIVGGTEPADNATFVTNTPTLTAYFADVTETVDAGSVVMTVDGDPVSPSFNYNNPTSAVSYTVTSPFDPETTHTAKVVVASTPSGMLYTNEWSFTVAPVAGNIVYVDADPSNTLGWDGSTFTTFNPDGVGSNWTTRSTFGNNGQVYQSLDGIAQRLETTVSGLPQAAYDVYAFMWVQGNDWRIGADLINNLSGELPLYLTSQYPVNTALSVPWAEYSANTWGDFSGSNPTPYYSSNLGINPFLSGDVMVAEADRRLMQVYLGRIVGTGFSVYVDDDIAAGDRTWYDGVGYEEVTGGPSSDPVIQSIIVAGGNATLTWTSEFGPTYSIMQRDALPLGDWTPVATGIVGEAGTTTYAVPVSGENQEFFRVEAP